MSHKTAYAISPAQVVEFLREDVKNELLGLARDYANSGDVEMAKYIRGVADRTEQSLEEMHEALGDVIESRNDALRDAAGLRAAMMHWETTQNQEVRGLVEEIEETVVDGAFDSQHEIITDMIFDNLVENLSYVGLERVSAIRLAQALMDGGLGEDAEALKLMERVAALGMGEAEPE